jgi:hypothetical protein
MSEARFFGLVLRSPVPCRSLVFVVFMIGKIGGIELASVHGVSPLRDCG